MKRVVVCVETPRFGFVKRRADGTIDFVSPIPCPFHYGSVPGTSAADGDPFDAVVVGPTDPSVRVTRGTELQMSVYGEVRFIDAGLVDTKLVTASRPPTWSERMLVAWFFDVYARAKRVLNRVRGVRGDTRVHAIDWEAS